MNISSRLFLFIVWISIAMHIPRAEEIPASKEAPTVSEQPKPMSSEPPPQPKSMDVDPVNNAPVRVQSMGAPPDKSTVETAPGGGTEQPKAAAIPRDISPSDDTAKQDPSKSVPNSSIPPKNSAYVPSSLNDPSPISGGPPGIGDGVPPKPDIAKIPAGLEKDNNGPADITRARSPASRSDKAFENLAKYPLETSTPQDVSESPKSANPIEDQPGGPKVPKGPEVIKDGPKVDIPQDVSKSKSPSKVAGLATQFPIAEKTQPTAVPVKPMPPTATQAAPHVAPPPAAKPSTLPKPLPPPAAKAPTAVKSLDPPKPAVTPPAGTSLDPPKPAVKPPAAPAVPIGGSSPPPQKQNTALDPAVPISPVVKPPVNPDDRASTQSTPDNSTPPARNNPPTDPPVSNVSPSPSPPASDTPKSPLFGSGFTRHDNDWKPPDVNPQNAQATPQLIRSANEAPGRTRRANPKIDDSSIRVEPPPSTAPAQPLLNLLPFSKQYNFNAVQDLVSGSFVVVLSLGGFCGDACAADKVSTVQQGLPKDISNALKNDLSLVPFIRVLNVLVIDFKTVVQLTIMSSGDTTTPQSRVNQLQTQLADRNNFLYTSGEISKFVDPAVFGVDIVGQLKSDSLVDVESRAESDIIVYTSIATYLFLMGVFIVAYRVYVRRVKREQRLARKELSKIKTWGYKSLKFGFDSDDEEPHRYLLDVPHGAEQHETILAMPENAMLARHRDQEEPIQVKPLGAWSFLLPRLSMYTDTIEAPSEYPQESMYTATQLRESPKQSMYTENNEAPLVNSAKMSLYTNNAAEEFTSRRYSMDTKLQEREDVRSTYSGDRYSFNSSVSDDTIVIDRGKMNHMNEEAFDDYAMSVTMDTDIWDKHLKKLVLNGAGSGQQHRFDSMSTATQQYRYNSTSTTK